jgi:hypothetical protein
LVATADQQIERVQEALVVLEQLGLPKRQQNVRTALVLLSMCNLDADQPWGAAVANSLGITESMHWMAEHYPDVKKAGRTPAWRRTTQ